MDTSLHLQICALSRSVLPWLWKTLSFKSGKQHSQLVWVVLNEGKSNMGNGKSMNTNEVETSVLVKVLARQGVPTKGFLKTLYNNKEATSRSQSRVKGSCGTNSKNKTSNKGKSVHPKTWNGGGGGEWRCWKQVENWRCGRGTAQEEL